VVENIARRVEARLQRDLGDRYLRVAFDHDIERFKIGQQSAVVSDQIDWFYIVTNGNSGFRNPEAEYERVLKKVHSLNMNNQAMRWTPEQFVKKARDIIMFNREKRRDEVRYRLKAEARAFLRAAEKDGFR